jgi:hypothetical protein
MATPLTGPCEASVNWSSDRKPTLVKCGRLGTVRMKYLLPFGVILCDECDARMAQKKDTETT